jgi:hypothetical protein
MGLVPHDIGWGNIPNKRFVDCYIGGANNQMKKLIENYPRSVNSILFMLAGFMSVIGATMVVELPADRKIRAMVQQRETETIDHTYLHMQQTTSLLTRDLQNIRWQKEDLLREVNRVHSIGTYLDRPATEQELDYIDEIKSQLALMRDLEVRTMKQLRGH